MLVRGTAAARPHAGPRATPTASRSIHLASRLSCPTKGPLLRSRPIALFSSAKPPPKVNSAPAARPINRKESTEPGALETASESDTNSPAHEDDPFGGVFGRIFKEAEENSEEFEKDKRLETAELKKALLRADINLQGGEYFRLGMYEEAEAAFTRVLEMVEEDHGPEHMDVATVLNNLAMVQANQGQMEKAVESLKRGLEIRETVMGASDETLITPLNNLGLVCKRMKQFDMALEYFERSLSLMEDQKLQDDAQFGTTLNNMASVKFAQGKLAEARDLLRRAADTVVADHPELPTVLDNLLVILKELKQWDEALQCGERLLALQLEEENAGPAVVRTLLQLADVQLARGDKRRAIERLEAAHEIERTLGEDSSRIAKRLEALKKTA